MPDGQRLDRRAVRRGQGRERVGRIGQLPVRALVYGLPAAAGVDPGGPAPQVRPPRPAGHLQHGLPGIAPGPGLRQVHQPVDLLPGRRGYAEIQVPGGPAAAPGPEGGEAAVYRLYDAVTGMGGPVRPVVALPRQQGQQQEQQRRHASQAHPEGSAQTGPVPAAVEAGQQQRPPPGGGRQQGEQVRQHPLRQGGEQGQGHQHRRQVPAPLPHRQPAQDTGEPKGQQKQDGGHGLLDVKRPVDPQQIEVHGVRAAAGHRRPQRRHCRRQPLPQPPDGQRLQPQQAQGDPAPMGDGPEDRRQGGKANAARQQPGAVAWQAVG